VQAQLARMDPGNEYMVNWLWGFTTVGINVDKVKAALGSTPMPDNAWDLVFKPEYISQAQELRRLLPRFGHRGRAGGAALPGQALVQQEPGDYAPPRRCSRAVRPHITLFSSSGYINDMANGSICVALGWSGDINIARQRAIDGKTGHNIQALLPKTGGLLFFDVMVIPADAPRPGNAHKFINYILRPEVHAGLTNKVFYANPNTESKKFVKPEVAANPTVFLPPAELAKMVPPDSLNNDLRRLMTRTYTSFKTGLSARRSIARAGAGADATAFLQIQDLVKDFGGYKAVNHVSLDIAKGEIFALLGSSGCGKSTLLRMLAGFETPTSGRIVLAGRTWPGAAALRAADEHDVPELRAVPAPDGVGEHRLRPAREGLPKRRRSPSAWRRCSSWCSWASSPSASRTSSRAASSSAWRWRAAWPSSRSCCCWTSRWARWTRSCASRRRSSWSTSSSRSA
jgi:hypothetical protein